MHRRSWAKSTCSALAIAAMLQPAIAAAADPNVVPQPPSSDMVMSYATKMASEPALSYQAKLDLLRQKVKYVFVLFQENRSFDFHFGTFPGARGLFSQPPSQTPGFYQPLVDTDGTAGTISPFLIPQTVQANGQTVQIYPADTYSVDHSHTGINNDLNPNAAGQSMNDRYALDQEGLTTKDGQIVSIATGLPPTSNPTLVQKQKGQVVMAHDDCDTVPFLWQFADRFVLFDNFYQTIIGPSTPNAIAMIAGQSGETQWALHPELGSNNTASPTVAASGGVPIVGDPASYPGSDLDFSPIKPAINPADENPAKPTLNQTYASLPLSFMGRDIRTTIQSDQNPGPDLADVQRDIRKIASDALPPVNWRWYQQGYDLEPTDTDGVASHKNYIWHHNGPEYFGYVGDNPVAASNLRGLGDFFGDVAKQALPAEGGVFYVRGGYGNNDGLKPLDPNPAVQAAFMGNDDHASYSDTQISEALVADEVNAIASSPYWKDSAIIITYDETDGDYDHTVPRFREWDPEGNPLAAGPRIPAIVISPYARAHVISHEYSEHSSVIKFINELYGLTPLANLPDEVLGRQLGQQRLGQPNLGPADKPGNGVTALFSAFDNARLTGRDLPLPASYAMIPQQYVTALPHYASLGGGCYVLSIVPTDYQNGVLVDPAPVDFNPRPTLTPGVPTAGDWTP